MFTGLVEDVGRIEAVEPGPSGGGADAGSRRLTLATRLADPARPGGEEMPLGASLAVDGVCLTVTAWQPGRVSAVAAAETLARTTLGRLAAGDPVNLERPLRVGDRLGGHLVAGHVDGVGTVLARTSRGVALDVTVAAPPELLRYVIEKGSIAVDGISLTVNRVDERGFDVSLVPHTQAETTLGKKPVGAGVNLEVDLIGKYVEKLVLPHAGRAAGGVTLDTLKEHGFV